MKSNKIHRLPQVSHAVVTNKRNYCLGPLHETVKYLVKLSTVKLLINKVETKRYVLSKYWFFFKNS